MGTQASFRIHISSIFHQFFYVIAGKLELFRCTNVNRVSRLRGISLSLSRAFQIEYLSKAATTVTLANLLKLLP